MISAKAVCEAVALGRVSLSNEKQTQADLDELLVRAFGREAVKREARLGPGDIPDFMVEGIAVEVKIKGSESSILRQLARYADHDVVEAIVLVSGRAIRLPAFMNDKPAYYVSLGRSWL